MKRMFWLAAVTAVVIFPVASTLGRKNPETQGLAANSGQGRRTEKSSSVSAEEEQVVRKLLADRREAFNRHDVKTGCSYFADDADFVNVAGSWWKGKQEIEKKMTELYAGMFKNIHFNDSETLIRFITPDVAVAHFEWEVTGIVGPDGSPRPPRQGIATFLVDCNS
jgi:uncharacterized protein (TIGR02246 family)